MSRLVIRAIVVTAVVAVIFTGSFLWGALTIRNQIFPHTLLASIISAQPTAIRDEAEDQYEADRLWLERLQKGGYFLVVRHTEREKWLDVSAFDMYAISQGINAEGTSFSRAVCLTPRGIEEARLLGEILRFAGIGIRRAFSSPSCRAVQTAQSAGWQFEISNTLLHVGAVNPSQRDSLVARFRQALMTWTPEPGANILLSTHGNVLRDDIVDINRMGQMSVEEGGVMVVSVTGDTIVAEHKFNSITDLARVVFTIDLDVDQD